MGGLEKNKQNTFYTSKTNHSLYVDDQNLEHVLFGRMLLRTQEAYKEKRGKQVGTKQRGGGKNTHLV